MVTLLWIIPIAVSSYLFIGAIYRLYFHPLSKFPGPKVAALTYLYELYFDAFQGGQYIWEIKRLHERYGPIIRINPSQLHIKDSYYFDEIYSSRKQDKDYHAVAGFGVPGSVISAIDHEHHRFRRNLLNNFFSRRSVMNTENLVLEKIGLVIDYLEHAFKEKEIVKADALFAAFTSDVISQFAYGWCFDTLKDKALKNEIRDMVTGQMAIVPIARYFPPLIALLDIVPPSLVEFFKPKTRGLFNAKRRVSQQCADTLRECSERAKRGIKSQDRVHKTVFEAICNPSLPPEELAIHRLRDEAMGIYGAGAETSARVLTMGAFYIYRDKSRLLKLREELKQVLPTVDSKANWIQLESLPYLTAVINESLRLTHTAPGRFPRAAKTETLAYKEYTIPPGTSVSQSNYFVHMDPEIFPNPEKFDPERWIRATQEGVRLERFLVAFSKGHRICLGFNLAYLELYTAFASIVRRFDMDLHDTLEENIRFAREFVLGAPKIDTNGVQMKVVSIVD
ncbi:hypothetical protein FQN57_004423 [Myotisia sp. PD_48]|nr:hypothetical protein FQN57_004423 [Myotisia sp. PD_48]